MNIRRTHKRQRKRRKKHWARRTHRGISIFAMLFLLMLAVTGILLNHSDGLGLSRSSAGTWVQRMYGIEAPPITTAYSAGGMTFMVVDNMLFVDAVALAPVEGDLRGATQSGDEILLMTSNELIYLSSNGALIERAPLDDPAQFEGTVTWSERTSLSEDQRERIVTAVLAKSLNWERVLLDLHSGRLLPKIGIFIADLAALCLMYLCITGTILWFRRGKLTER